jgi:hypothetical protein
VRLLHGKGSRPRKHGPGARNRRADWFRARCVGRLRRSAVKASASRKGGPKTPLRPRRRSGPLRMRLALMPFAQKVRRADECPDARKSASAEMRALG